MKKPRWPRTVPFRPLNETYVPRDDLVSDVAKTLSDPKLHPDIRRMLLGALGDPITKDNAQSKANRREPRDPYLPAIRSLARKLDRKGLTGKAMREALRGKFKHLAKVSDSLLDRRIKNSYLKLRDNID